MGAKLRIGAILTFVVAIFGARLAWGAANLSATPSTVVVLNLSDLRSAYLLRAGEVRYDATDTSPQAIREQIQQHFGVVLGILAVSTPRSIETALSRLQVAYGANWSTDERRRWRQQLLANRYRQMVRLAAYRNRGLFPQNEGISTLPMPIFVDRHDTACAVGHLMRLSGWQTATARIQAANNLVFVPDAARSVLVRWVFISGLTLEEAALIQPGYPMVTPLNFTDYGPGEAVLEKDGLRFSDFTLESQNYSIVENPHNYPDDVCSLVPVLCAPKYTPTNHGSKPNPEVLGMNAGADAEYGQPGIAFVGVPAAGTHWILFGGVESADDIYTSDPESWRFLETSTRAGTAQSVVIRFDVSTIDARARLNQVFQSSFAWHGGFSLHSLDFFPDKQFSMTTRVLSNGVEIASASFRSTDDYAPNSRAVADFELLRQITVETEIWIENYATIHSFPLDFTVIEIPEPNAAFLLAFGAFLVVSLSKQRQVLPGDRIPPDSGISQRFARS